METPERSTLHKVHNGRKLVPLIALATLALIPQGHINTRKKFFAYMYSVHTLS